MKQLLFLALVVIAGRFFAQTAAYPFPVSYFEIQAQREHLEMAYMDLAPAVPNGKSVLLLHGKNFNGAYWEQTARDLSQAGYRVVIPDQVGFGKSSQPNQLQFSFQLLATFNKQLLDHLGIPSISVVGHSMGGMLATRFALMYPEMTAQLILENPLGLEDWKTMVPYQTVEMWYAGELQQDYEKIKQYQLTNYYDNRWKPAYERWARMQADRTADPDYPRIAWNSALLYDMIFTQPVCYEFDRLQMPVLLLIGQRDRTAIGKDKAPEQVRAALGNYPELGKTTAQKIPNATLVEIKNTGHLPHIESYDAFIVPLLDFLKKE